MLIINMLMTWTMRIVTHASAIRTDVCFQWKICHVTLSFVPMYRRENNYVYDLFNSFINIHEFRTFSTLKRNVDARKIITRLMNHSYYSHVYGRRVAHDA
jgi:hypothetical protein